MREAPARIPKPILLVFAVVAIVATALAWSGESIAVVIRRAF